VLDGRGSKPPGWTSHATFTFGSVPAAGRGATGTYTSADSTVPPGIPGNAEIDLGMGLSGNEKDFRATIGADPSEDTNVSQFVLGFRNYHGAGSYPLTSASDADLHVTVRNWRGDAGTWGTERSATATCAVRIAADAAMRDPSIRRISGTFACSGLLRREQPHEHHHAAGPLRRLHRGVVWGLENPALPPPAVGHHTWPSRGLTRTEGGAQSLRAVLRTHAALTWSASEVPGLPRPVEAQGYADCVSRCRMVPSAMMSPSGHRHWILPPSNESWYSAAYTPPSRSRERWVPDSTTFPASMT
jgi:hypothetical protein